MDSLAENACVLLIGGSSHSGKSTLAKTMAGLLGWGCRSTDRLARHPGRPWRTDGGAVPPHVADHYLSLSTDELLADVVRHYRDNVWPLVERIVSGHTSCAAGGIVIEGSAVLPDLAAPLIGPRVRGLWLTAGADAFRTRIYASSAYETQSPRGKRMIDRFLARTEAFDAHVVDAARRCDLDTVDTVSFPGQRELAEHCLAMLTG